MVFEDLDLPSHKTKNIVNHVSQMGNTKKLLMVDGGPIDEKLKLATQNLHYVNVLPSIVSSKICLSEVFICVGHVCRLVSFSFPFPFWHHLGGNQRV